jgi:hypothetical protein
MTTDFPIDFPKGKPRDRLSKTVSPQRRNADARGERDCDAPSRNYPDHRTELRILQSRPKDSVGT